MELFLSKLVPLWLYPLGLAILVVLLVGLGALFRGRWGSAFLLLFVGCGLWAVSTFQFSGWLHRALEHGYPEQRAEALPEADAIVLLGGAMNPTRPPRAYGDFNLAADRVLHAWRLFQAKRAPLILISGGQLPWNQAARSEAEEVAELLEAWGVPRDRIVVEGASRNTRDNAVFTRALLEQRDLERVLLVTSASHMRRALGAFARVGVDAVPAATDHHAVDVTDTTPLDWMPDTEALFLTTLALKEHLGWWYYRWKGWV